jgi:glutamine amidotransferase
VYKGRDPILLSNLILDPAHSILTQSYDSRLRLDRRRPHNGDGFGVGYYTDPLLGPEPCIFTSTIPAWNCINLERLASKTTSALIFAHVRATTEGNLSDQNCHPFRYGSLMFMHNGGIGGWRHVKRRLAASLKDEWFIFVQGGTDSEWAFALFLDSMSKMGYNPSEPPSNGFGHTVLRKAILETIRRINKLIAEIPEECREEDTRSLLNFAVTDGISVVCTRYVSSRTDEAASLFWSSGTNWRENCDGGGKKGDYKMERRDKGADIVLVASEPLTFERGTYLHFLKVRDML